MGNNTGSATPNLTGFHDLDKLRDSSGLVAIISQRHSNNVITFTILKEFERDGQVERTGFIPETLSGPYMDMVKLVMERIVELRKDPKIQAIKPAYDTRHGRGVSQARR